MGQKKWWLLRSQQSQFDYNKQKNIVPAREIQKYSPTHTEIFQKDYLHQDKRNEEKNTIQK